jgi:imidazolonepropionase-like amidohydrolase
MSTDPAVSDFAPGVRVVDTRILAVGPNLKPGDGAGVIDSTSRIVTPGFIDTHHPQFETGRR